MSDSQPLSRTTSRQSENLGEGMSSAKRYKRDEDEQFYKLGMRIPRLVHPFLPIGNLLNYGLLLYVQQKSDGSSVQLDNEVGLLDPSERETYLSAFTVLIEQSPWLSEHLEPAMEDESQMHKLEHIIGRGISQGHCNDSSVLKIRGLDWVMDDLTKPLNPPITKSRSKSDRGFYHPILAKMLCPAVKLDQLETDPEYINELRLGNVSDEDWPAFCYEGGQCDPDDLEKGLFRGVYLLRIFRRIFTGPKSVTSEEPGPTPKAKNVAQIMNMTQVTPRAIAYATVQARLTLSDKDEWSEYDGNFNYRRFYESIVTVFESDPDLPWVKDTLQWWNQNVFFQPSRRDRPGHGSKTMAQCLREQRQRRQQN